MRWLLRYLVLPPEITDFERAHLARLNRIALVFFWLHLPAFVGVAALAGTSMAMAALLTTVVLIGPTLAYYAVPNPRTMAVVAAVTAMIMGGVLVFVGQGPMQIEMHFYFFVLIALLAVFGNPLAIVAAAATVATHHLVMWLVFVRGVFNYDAPVWAVAVHAAFVVIETVAACFVARSFFDNVIGLERIVAARTREVDARNRDLRLVLDSVEQGFITVELDGRVIGTPSRIVGAWFGTVATGDRIWDLLGGGDARATAWARLAWESLAEGSLPVELALDQLPRERRRDGRTLRFAYRPVGDGEPPAQLVVIVTDATSDVARELAEQSQRELVAALERSARDRRGFVEFVVDADRLMTQIEAERSLVEVQRALHTVKGNTSLYGVVSVSTKCQALESKIAEERRPPSTVDRGELESLWRAYRQQVAPLIGERTDRVVEVERAELDAALAEASPHPSLSARLRRWRDEPVGQRLARLAEAAQPLARRLGKPDLQVDVDADGVALDPERWAPFWAALVHAVRNAIDHGIEPPAEREARGKPAHGRLSLRCRHDAGAVVLEIADDGRGIDWDALAARAAAAGHSTTDRAALVAALFTDGVSTRDEVTEVSGRGVGLAAVRAATTALGGTVTVDSQPGAGTSFTFRFPHRRGATSPPPVRAHAVGASA